MSFNEDALKTHFGRIWPIHNDAFCELMLVLRRQFGGDLDRMLVLAIIGSRTISRGRIEGMSYDNFNALERPDDEPAPTST
ncbi:MAG: hypothetical protein K9L70_11710 [Thiohalocapsa sp.]|nr:hypothetical protein [Thiohalocapsa sp.]MCF7991424.1 hypothetical protein [Thiohalocapsa sp.]